MPPAQANSTYSVIQCNLDETVTLQQLEAASMHAPSIARADCPRIHRMLAGIYISRLPHPEALAFQRGLAAQGLQAEVVADSLLPALPTGMRAMRVSRIDDELHFRDFMDRPTVIPFEEILFIAAACIEDTTLERTITLKEVNVGRGISMSIPETRLRDVPDRLVRIDIFFSRAPHRLTLSAADATRFFVQDQPVYLRKPEVIAWAFQMVRGWAPAECRINRHIRHDHPLQHRVPTEVYEEEIRWRFHRLREQAANP
jgi:hypothetical protein